MGTLRVARVLASLFLVAILNAQLYFAAPYEEMRLTKP